MSVKQTRPSLWTWIACASATLLFVVPVLADDIGEMSLDQRNLLEASVRSWLSEQAEGSENVHGKKTKRGHYSRDFREVDGGFEVTAHLESAGEITKTVERYLLTLKGEGDKWSVSDSALEDTYEGMHRNLGVTCHPFSKFDFNREGMRLTGGSGTACISYYQGRAQEFYVKAANPTYVFSPPEHATALHLMPDFHALYDRVKTDHTNELEFTPDAFLFDCTVEVCEELIAETLNGLEGYEPGAREFDFEKHTGDAALAAAAEFARPLLENTTQGIAENPFAGFRTADRPGQRYYSVYVAREVEPFRYPGGETGFSDVLTSLPGAGVRMVYNNWGGYEMELQVYPRRLGNPDALFGTIYGYYTEETLKNSDPYSIETREDQSSRWHQVYAVNGDVSMGIEDPEILEADITFGIELKQPQKEVPFAIQSIPQREFSGKNKARVLFVNSVQLDGEELTWTRTSQLGGLVILPEVMPAGSKLNIRMNFKTRAMYKVNYAFTYVSRFGWMPFVRFGDFIDDFQLTIRTPSEYTLLGIGHEVEKKKEGKTTVSTWRSDSPVVFPSIAMGRYKADDAGKPCEPTDKKKKGCFDPATKADGTPIPVTVHVDEVSFTDWGIRPLSLRPIAQQAINSINLFRELSGLDYPYGELNFVNDPQGFLYGQAPSSLIYLGSGVFRGEGFLAATLQGANSTGIAKFLKSVVAHEVGHQWWGSKVSNANGRNYWFVETLAEYFSALYLEGVFGEKEYEEQVDEWRRTILNSEMKASVQNASTVWSGELGGSYQANVYNKGPFAFHMLRQIFGDEKFFPFLKQFSQELAEKREIVTMDIQNAAENALGGVDPDGNPYNVDLDWFFSQWIRSSGLPQFRFDYDTRETEDGGYLIEGVVEQRVVVGSKHGVDVLDNSYFRGVVDITVKTKKEEYKKRLIVDGKETPFRLKVPAKPVEVVMNEKNETLSHDTIINQDW